MTEFGSIESTRAKQAKKCNVKTPNELWEMIADLLMESYWGHTIMSRITKSPAWVSRRHTIDLQ